MSISSQCTIGVTINEALQLSLKLMFSIHFNYEEIELALYSLQIQKAIGPDNLSIMLLKSLANVLPKCLSLLVIATKTMLPKLWKTGDTPQQKTSSIDNLRSLRSRDIEEIELKTLRNRKETVQHR